MLPEEIADILKSRFGEGIVDVDMNGPRPRVKIKADRWKQIATFLRDDKRLRMNLLRCVSGVDWPDDGEIEVTFDLMSVRSPEDDRAFRRNGGAIAISLRVPRDGGSVATVADLWPAADWHERETYDLFGVTFDGHPDFRRILCPDDWVGHPLRKDYVFPQEYHGIPGTVADIGPAGSEAGESQR